MGNLFGELKRRNVVRVGIAYVVLSWVVLQVGDVLFDMFGTPDWVGKTLAVLLALGFPFACLFAWAFELTPEGIKKTRDVDISDSVTHSTGRRLNAVIIAALVIALGYFIWERQGLVAPDDVAASTAEIDRSIAVLPFVNMSSDQEQEWFADGLTEEILNALARTPDLLVASRTSSFEFKGQNTDISEIARTLGVAHILEGSVRRGGERLRVTAQLIRASDGFHLWSETFDRKPEDVIAIQEDVAFEIAKALKTAMDPEALKQMVSAGTASVAAYEAYLEGLALEGMVGSTGNVADWPPAMAAFVRARNLDGEFSLAWYHEAIYWESQLQVTNVGSELSDHLTAEAKYGYFSAAIDAAIETAASPERGLLFKSMKAEQELRFADAIGLAEQFVQAFPNSLEGMEQLINSIALVRDTERARSYVQQLLALSHDDPLLLNALINNLLFVGLVDETVALARDVLERFSEHSFLVYQAHRALLWAGHVEEARKWAQMIRGSEFPQHNIYLVEIREACAEGNVELARQFVEKIVASGAGSVSTVFVANQIMGRPAEAHQHIVEQGLSGNELMSFMIYPYFDHTYFPKIVAPLERQGIDRPFIKGPPYACPAD
jgi:TolB-like protein